MDASAVKPEAHAKNNKSPVASDHLPAETFARIIQWLHTFGGVGQVGCVVRQLIGRISLKYSLV